MWILCTVINVLYANNDYLFPIVLLRSIRQMHNVTNNEVFIFNYIHYVEVWI